MGDTTHGVPPERTGLAGGVLNTAMELGPTVVFAIVLTFGSDAVSLAATGVALALVAALNLRVQRTRPSRPSSLPQGAIQ
ncbi:hypothetical protein ACFWMG_16000 [Streptomyces sp. NPDC127074]|uniref:hypothetical protein n=1 Tax=Streptomyces sp. NPDC127074 TaxID=3347130 RepID=UPI003665FEEA